MLVGVDIKTTATARRSIGKSNYYYFQRCNEGIYFEITYTIASVDYCVSCVLSIDQSQLGLGGLDKFCQHKFNIGGSPRRVVKN